MLQRNPISQSTQGTLSVSNIPSNRRRNRRQTISKGNTITFNMATSGSRAPHPLKSTSIGLKKRQNAPFSRTAFNICPGDQNIVSNSDITHHLPSLFSKYSRNLPNIVSNSVMFRQHVTSMASLSFIYPVLDFLYIATLLITRSGDVVLYPGPSMNPNSVNSSFDSYTTLTNSGLSIMNLKPETETRHSNSKNPTMRCSCLYWNMAVK